jgi:hypothetical protein
MIITEPEIWFYKFGISFLIHAKILSFLYLWLLVILSDTRN